jgi:hypothetical protein
MPESNTEVQKWVIEHFGYHSGCLWELGAFDGESDSITRALLTRPVGRWEGLLVEGNCANYERARQSYEKFENVKCVHAVLGESNSVSTWWDDGGHQESTILKSHMDEAIPRINSVHGVLRNYTEKTVGTLSVHSLWDWWKNTGKTSPDLVICDLEGMSEVAASGLISAGCRPEVVVVETDSPSILDSFGYYITRRVAPDIIFARKRDGA